MNRCILIPLLAASACWGMTSNTKNSPPTPAASCPPPCPPPAPLPCPCIEYCPPQTPQWCTRETWIDFLYLQPLQDNLEPTGVKQSIIAAGFSGLQSGPILNMAHDYKPAFEIGQRFNFEHANIDLTADYFRFVSTEISSGSDSQYYPMTLDPSTLLAFLNGISVAGGGIGTAAPFSFDQTWDLKINFIDLTMGWLQSSTGFVHLHPFLGLRGGWVNQSLVANFTANLVNGGVQVGTAGVILTTTSWAIGIRGGIDLECPLGDGFSIYALEAGDFLYQSYNWRGVSAASVPTATVDWNSDVFQDNIPKVRAHLESELGLRWSKYFNENRQKLSFSAGYGFQVFFDQNMFRHFTTIFEEISFVNPTSILSGIIGTPVSNSPDGDLFLHGLRIEGSITF